MGKREKEKEKMDWVHNGILSALLLLFAHLGVCHSPPQLYEHPLKVCILKGRGGGSDFVALANFLRYVP